MPSPFDDIFGSRGPQWTTEQITSRIRSEAKAQGVDPDLAVAVATQESWLSPEAKGDGGKSIGLFQLQEAAAKEAGIDPRWRDDPGLNIYGGVRYLKQKLDQSKGNIDEALSRYNRGTPDYRGIGDPNYVQNVKQFLPGRQQAQARPGMLARAANVLSPASAEAATSPQGASGAMWDDIFGAQQPAPATAPSPPTATSTPGQDAAYRASRGQQEPATATQTPSPTITQPGGSQGPSAPNPAMDRFLALPSIRQLTPADRAGKQRDFAALTPALQEEFLRSEEPASDLTVDIEKSSQAAPRTEADRQQQVRAELAAWEQQAGRPWREGDPRMPSEKKLGVPDEAPVEETLSHPSVWGPLIAGVAGGAGGAALGRGAAALVGRGAKALPIVGEVLGSLGARKADVALGIEEPGTVGDVLSAAVPLVSRAVGAIAPAIVKRLPGSAGAQHEMMAERLQALPGKMTPATPSQTLYRAVVQQGNPAIPVRDLRQTVQELLALNAQRGAATRNPRVVRLAQEIEDLARQYSDNVPMDVLYDRMQGAGEILKQARRTGGRGERDLSRIYAGFHGSLENAAQSGIPGAETLQQAIKASRQEHAVDRLGRIVGQGRGIEEQAGSGYTFVKGKKMLNEFDRLVADDPVFAGSFTQAELDDMRGMFQTATKLPALPSAGGAQFGSGRAAVRASIGSMIGGPAGAAIAVSGPEVIARAMMTAPGRAMLRAALEGKGGLTPQALAVLNTALREQLPAQAP